MPGLPVKEVRLPELRLPEISREEIVRTLSEVRRPDLDLPWTDKSVDEVRAGRFARIRRPSLTLPSIDPAAMVGGAIAAIGVGRPRITRPRLGIVIGLAAIAALGVLLVARNPATRERIDRAARSVRRQGEETLEVEADAVTDAVADAADEVPAVVAKVEPVEAAAAAS